MREAKSYRVSNRKLRRPQRVLPNKEVGGRGVTPRRTQELRAQQIRSGQRVFDRDA